MPRNDRYTTLSMGILSDEERIASGGYELFLVTHWEDRLESGVQHAMGRAQRLEVARHLMRDEWGDLLTATRCITRNLQSPDADLEQVADAIWQISSIVDEMAQTSPAYNMTPIPNEDLYRAMANILQGEVDRELAEEAQQSESS